MFEIDNTAEAGPDEFACTADERALLNLLAKDGAGGHWEGGESVVLTFATPADADRFMGLAAYGLPAGIQA